MARNKVQFQKGISLTQFLKEYGTEEQCFEALCQWRWPNGFSCPHCGHDKHCDLSHRKLKQCNRCRRQTSITSRTIFDSTKLPLTTWFLGIFLITQDKKGISCMELSRHLGISYNATWRMKHKLMQVMMERDHQYKLSGFIELDDAYLGGERTGCKPGRGAKGKTPFVAAVETTKEGRPTRIKLSIVKGFRSSEISAWSKKHLCNGSTVISDGLACFNAVTAAGCAHDKIVCGGGRSSVEEPEFYWVNTVLGNLKSALRSTYHAIRPKYAQRYLAEFQYRFNRRFNLSALIPRLVFVSLRTPPMPERLLKISLA
ncbi:IS1595 family transposase [Microbulbifer sp. JMSA004]|uniref:IS1595 family transposase n=1 Tax=unclassified Microbulbifer TaxID=2619833 RepID=UPI00403AF036